MGRCSDGSEGEKNGLEGVVGRLKVLVVKLRGNGDETYTTSDGTHSGYVYIKIELCTEFFAEYIWR